MAILRVIRGFPGAGKSSFAKRSFPGTLLLENDMFHMHNGIYDWHGNAMPAAIKWCMDMARIALENKMDVVVANTFVKCAFIEGYKKLAEKFNAKFEVYRCYGNFQNTHGLDSKKVNSFKKSMEDWPNEIFVKPIEI